MFSRETLRRLWPHAGPALLDGVVAKAPEVFAKYGLDTPAIVAMFMAQISHECGAGTELVENLNYSAQGIVRTWPKRFSDIAAAMPYAHAPQKLTNTTGHDGYYRLALKMAIDLLNNPDQVNAPNMFLECAVVDFILCGCLPYARQGDFRMVTLRLNGGLIGLAQRQDWLKRWQSALAAEHGADAVIPLPAPRPAGVLLRMGDEGYKVKALQQRLSELGYACGTDDGQFHEATRDAVNSFKSVHGLPVDMQGSVDQATEDALTHEPIAKPVSEARADATADDLREAGSGTIASADKLKAIAKGAVVVAGGAGANQSGALDLAKDSLDQFSAMRSLLEGAQDALQWISAHWWIAAIGLGVAVWYFGHDVIERRLADHRNGLHLGR
jgi:putative chitinase